MIKYLGLIIFCVSCKKSNPNTTQAGFEKTPVSVNFSGGVIEEASGIADSKNIPGYLWVQEDSGNPPVIYLLKHDGTITDTVTIQGATNRDWEDIALADGKIYIGDFGDNNAAYNNYSIYRFNEPPAGAASVAGAEKITFTYPDGAHDAEALLVDVNSKDIFILTKRDTKSKLFRLAYPQNTSAVNQAEFILELPYTGVVSAAISPDGEEIIVKNYTTLNYYKKAEGESIASALTKTPSTLDYQVEAQGEAISFAINNGGFYTLSEKAFNVEPTLNFYKRK